MSSSLFQFFVGALRDPLKVGTLLPSSRWVVRRLMNEIDFDGVRCVVEFGPGTGVITQALLQRMPATARLLAIETDPGYVRHLREDIGSKDARLLVEQASAAELATLLQRHQLDHADVVVSGIPFTTLPDAVRDGILAATARALGEDGQLVVYQYTRAVVPYLKRYFSIDADAIEWRNTMPMRMFRCTPRPVPLMEAATSDQDVESAAEPGGSA